jgi:hypothetical protein
MKKVTLYFFFVLFFLSNISFSQSYIKLGGGYNLDFNSVNFATSTTSSETGNSSYEAVYGSLGKGVNIAGAFGYNFSSNLGLELGLIYKLSTEFESIDQSGTQTSTETANGSFFAFAPTLVITAPSKNVKPFVKFGLLVAIPSAEREYTSSGGYSETDIFSGSVDFGLTGGAGILVPLSPNIHFIAELDFVSLTWKPNEVEVKSPDGTITYKLEDEWTSSDQFTDGPVFLPFSNVGLNIGIQIGF